MPEIILDDIFFAYDKDNNVIQNINLKLDGPGLICIIGPNGVGKSTLIKCINKLLSPNSGDVYLDGINVKNIRTKALAKDMAYVPVSSQDCFAMSVVDSILIGRHNHQRWRTTDRDLEMVYKVMNLLDIEDLSMRSFNELSAGQHQKVSLARGLVQESKILILDEPTSNLDVRHQVYVAELLRAIAIRMEMTIIMISHDLNISAKYAHKIIVMSSPGIIHSIGTPNEVITETMIREVYGVECTIIIDGKMPHVILGSAIPTEK